MIEALFRAVTVVSGVNRFVFFAADDTLEQLPRHTFKKFVARMQSHVIRTGHNS